MNIFNFFKKKNHPPTIFDQVQALPKDIIVSGFRNVAEKRNIAPTSKTSDEKIMEIYEQVGMAFIEASNKRKVYLPGGQINTIVLGFLQLYEDKGETIFNEHLKIEVEKYTNEGLREEYKQDLDLLHLD